MRRQPCWDVLGCVAQFFALFAGRLLHFTLLIDLGSSHFSRCVLLRRQRGPTFLGGCLGLNRVLSCFRTCIHSYPVLRTFDFASVCSARVTPRLGVSHGLDGVRLFALLGLGLFQLPLGSQIGR